MIVQNVRHSNASWPIGNPAVGDIQMTFDFTGAPSWVARDNVRAMNATTGAIVDVPMTPVGTDAATLDFSLVAGDVLLFKYDTTAPFALRTNGPLSE